MRRISLLILVLAIVALAVVAPTVSADSYSTWAATPTINTGSAKSIFPETPIAFDTYSYTNWVATTTAKAITALASRKQITFAIANPAVDGTVWVMIGSTTAAANTGFPIYVATGTYVTKTFSLDGTVPMGFANSAALAVSVLQEGRSAGSDD